MSQSKFYHIPASATLREVGSAAQALTTLKEGGFIWLHYHQPTREELSSLIGTLGLHPLAVEDCFDDDQVPKIEDYRTSTFVLFNAIEYAEGKLSIDEVDLFLGGNFLVSVTHHDPTNDLVLAGMDKVVERSVENAREGPAFLMHVILDRIVDHKFAAIELLEDNLGRMEEAILAEVSRFDPSELIRLRRDLMALRKSVFHEREILTKICRKDCPFVSDKEIFHYRDIYDHLAKFFELTETYRDLVTSLMEMYLSLLNNQMTKAAQETNSTVRRLTFIATIFMPLTLIAGIGGMSEWTMMTGQENWRIAYPLFFLGMALLGLANYYALLWLERRRRRRGQSAV